MPRDSLIFVVDDFEALLNSLTRLLIASGYPLTQGYARAADAVQVMPYITPDLVLMDVALSRLDVYHDGCAAVTDIARRWPEVRCALLTGWSIGSPELALCPPGLPVLTKPYPAKHLGEWVEHILAQPPWKCPE